MNNSALLTRSNQSPSKATRLTKGLKSDVQGVQGVSFHGLGKHPGHSKEQQAEDGCPVLLHGMGLRRGINGTRLYKNYLERVALFYALLVKRSILICTNKQIHPFSSSSRLAEFMLNGFLPAVYVHTVHIGNAWDENPPEDPELWTRL